jgi:hypothetical protein
MPTFTSSQQSAIESLARDLEGIFASRLQALVAYPGNQGDGSVHSCALIEGLAFSDLVKCLPLTERWHHRGIAVPLMLSRDELTRTIDIFPLEYAAILADYEVVRGDDPFAGVTIPAEDVRRATEAQAKSHLIHLREAYLESHGEGTRISNLIVASAAPLRALLTNIVRLTGDSPRASYPDADLAQMIESRVGISAAVVREVLASSSNGHSAVTDASHLLSRYIEATQRLWEYVDGWRA